MSHVQQVQCNKFIGFLCDSHLLPFKLIPLITKLRRGMESIGGTLVFFGAAQVGILAKV